MQPTVKHSLICLSLALALLPLTHHKPGTPPTLKADEPAYYAAALSLVKDGDLRCEPEDLARLYREYPYTPIYNLILSTDDGWRTVYFGKPYLYSLLAAPLAAVWGANGLVLFNSLLLAAMIWMATLYLARFNPDWLAALFAAGFFLMSTTYRYVYWLQPEVLNMFSTAACLFFGLHVYGSGDRARRFAARLTANPDRLALVLSAAALAIGVYNKPMMAAMGLPVCFRLLRRRRWRDLGVWLASAALALGLFAGISTLLTGHPTSYLGVDRQGYNVHTPHVLPMEPAASADGDSAEAPELGRQTAGWWWIFQPPTITWSEFSEDLRYFFVGRHTGIFLYQPFSLLALGLFVLGPRQAYGWHRAERWVVLGSIAAVALFLLVVLSHNWHGGGGFVGNRYFLMVYPAFVFLVGRIRPDWIVVPGFAAGGLFLGALILSPFGLVVPSPTMQANVRNHPFDAFPLEHSLRELPGYWREARSGVFIQGRKDHLRIEGEELWIAAGERAELWLSSLEPLTELAFEVSSPVPDNPVTFRIEDAEARLAAGPEPQRVALAPSRSTFERYDRDRAEWQKLLRIYVYRLEVRAATGEVPRWRGEGEQFFYLGCRLRFLGIGEDESVRSES